MFFSIFRILNLQGASYLSILKESINSTVAKAKNIARRTTDILFNNLFLINIAHTKHSKKQNKKI
ncbi:MAG: hypothetical protein PHT81_05700 [Endomicrobiaceae bacterium]|nr:hypothetical protein [Endomicrobiaceae bacterium]